MRRPKNLLHKNDKVPRDKNLIIFDLDGTVTKSKTDMDEEMADLIAKLLAQKLVAIIGGGRYELFQRQFIAKLNISGDLFNNLFLFPTTATSFYRYHNGEWKEIYAERLSEDEKRAIFDAFDKTFKELNYVHPKEIYGEIIEDRGAQVTFSALGQAAPLELKLRWKDEHTPEKLKIAETLQKYLPNFKVGAAGYTSVDVTRRGIDKEYGIRQIGKYLQIPLEEMIFIGDALFPGGNDYPALATGIPCFEVKDIKDTKYLIKSLLG